MGYSALYILTLVLMAWVEHFPVSQAIAVLLIIGVFFTLIAYITSKSSTPLFDNKPIQMKELIVIIFFLVYITGVLSFGFDFIKTFLFQFFLGNGASPIREGLITKRQLLVGLPFLYVWLILEVGLAHAPGFYLRGGGTLDNLGQHPSLFMSIGYSILVLSVAGFFLATISIQG